jgi:hypothetical protein
MVERENEDFQLIDSFLKFVISARHYPSLLTGLRELGKCEAPSLSKDTLNFDLDIILKIHFQP